MNISVLTIFPELLESFFNTGIIGKARAAGFLTLNAIDVKKYTSPPHFRVDDIPFGGGPGMIMKAEPLVKAMEHSRLNMPNKTCTIALAPSGVPFCQAKAREFSQFEGLIFLCGRYEGIDARVFEFGVDEIISVGDYVMMGGEVASMAIIEATTRLISGILGNKSSIIEESFSETENQAKLSLEAPQYTRPRVFRGYSVPEVLFSGNHQDISKWRKDESLKKTAKFRPDLLVSKPSNIES